MKFMYQPTVVITRFDLKHWWLAPVLRLWFWRVSREMRATSDRPLESLLLQESLGTYVALSIWSEPSQMMGSAVPRHVQAVGLSRKWCKEIWTTQWHLTRVSPSAHSWSQSGVNWWAVAQDARVDHGWAGAGTACDGHPVSLWPQPVAGETDAQVTRRSRRS